MCGRVGGGEVGILKNKNMKTQKIHEVLISQDDDNDEQKCINGN
jgi:hypothetical protein